MPETEKKNRKKGVAALAILLTALLLAALAGCWWIFSNYVLFDGQLLPRNTQTLDLRGQEVTDAQVQKAEDILPGATILYDVTIAGVTYPSDETHVVTGDLTAADVEKFSAFKALEDVDASACTDVAVILALREALPGVNVHWEVGLGDKTISGDAEKLTISGVTAEELTAALRRLPSVKTVTLNGDPIPAADQLALQSAFPEISFNWIVRLAGKNVQSSAESLDLSGRSLASADLRALEEALPLLAGLTKIDFTDTGLDNETLVAFSERHPEIFTVWDTELFGVEFSTGAEEISFDDIPLTIEDAARIEALLPPCAISKRSRCSAAASPTTTWRR